MKIRVRMDLAFDITKRTEAEQLRDALVPFAQHAVNIHEGEDNQEIGYIEVENCHHDEVPPKPCELIARWEVGKGRVI